MGSLKIEGSLYVHTVVPFLKTLSREGTPLEWHKFLAASSVHVCDAPSHQRSPLYQGHNCLAEGLSRLEGDYCIYIYLINSETIKGNKYFGKVQWGSVCTILHLPIYCQLAIKLDHECLLIFYHYLFVRKVNISHAVLFYMCWKINVQRLRTTSGKQHQTRKHRKSFLYMCPFLWCPRGN